MFLAGRELNLHLHELQYKFIRTSSEMDAGLYKIYSRIWSKFSAHTGLGGGDLKVLDTSRVKALIL